MDKDRLFAEKRDLIQNFDFGKNTANVFDDMLDRSVPFYEEIQRMTGDLCADFAVPGTNIYDLGCSTCNTFFAIEKNIPADCTCVGLDSSPEMIEKAREKLAARKFSRPFQLERSDLNQGVTITNASVVILTLTLQFVRPLFRQKVIESIVSGLNPDGCLILVEKVLTENSTINRLFIKHYYEMKKRNGYTEMEIAQKREALENILIPYHYDENRRLLLDHGFRACDIFFRWYNFCGIVAIK
ncbi:MAG TPA: carboxy-S-adenosyl-L-methionine synthase CmoA [Kiritimatiellia bacterium]|nr:carboxy-S-adenosyl-L-methionine synthase CmoA [Kiritimatiellia bacterium]